MTESKLTEATRAEFARQPTVAYVETDRYCDNCGYNLRTQAVRPDPRTGILLSLCPECGSFLAARDNVTAGRAWLRRLGTMLVLIWIPMVIGGAIGLWTAQVGVTFGTFDELTTYERVPVTKPAPTTSTAAPTQPAVDPFTGSVLPALASLPAIQTTRVGGATTITISGTGSTQSSIWRPVPRSNIDEWDVFIVFMHILSGLLGFLLVMLAMVTVPHWRRWGYLILAITASLTAALLVFSIMYYDMPELFDWFTPYILTLGAVHLVGGLAAVMIGRVVMRFVATVILPPRLRQVLAYL
ncbi:MAG: hypothetical protein ABIG44_15055 [Planctomycetota bacterium]